MTSLSLLQALVFEPKKAFAALDARPRSLFPLLLVLIGSVGVAIWYMQVVDHEWMTDRQIRLAQDMLRGTALEPPPMSEEQIAERAKSGAENATRSTVVTALGTLVWLLFFRLLEAVYYLLAGKMTGVQRSFRHWFSLGCWTSLPTLLSVIPAAVILATATTTQIDQSSLQVLSLNSLFFDKQPSETGYTLLTFLTVPQFLGVFLAVFGVRVWTGRSWLFGVMFAGLPMLLLCALTFLILVRA
jgi:hypothetical protein